MPSARTFDTFDPNALEFLEIERRRRLADALQARSLESPQTQMAGRVAIRRSPLEGAARLAQALSANQINRQATEQATGLQDRRRQAIADWLRGMPQQSAASVQETAGEGTGAFDMAGTTGPAVTPGRMPTAQDYMLWAGQGTAAGVGPQAMALGTMGAQFAQQGALREDQQRFQAEQAQLMREGRVAEARQRAEEQAARDRQRAADELTRQRERGQDRQDQIRLAASLRQAPTPPAPEPLVPIIGPDGKPVLATRSQAVGATPYSPRADQQNAARLPTPALRLQQESIEAINTAGSIDADLGAVERQIKEGSLRLGPVENVRSGARNIAGMSNENSRNFQTFKATLERLRNESLRLNKGVQTEGDAQRAWNELMSNINDQKVVQQRLGEIRQLNQRAVRQQRMNIDTIRGNYGAPPLDDAVFASQPPTLGNPGSSDDPLGIRKPK